MFGLGNSEEMSKEEVTDVVGQHLESFIAIFIKGLGKLENFAVGNKLEVEGVRYAYQFNIHKQGTKGFKEIDRKFQQAQQ